MHPQILIKGEEADLGSDPSHNGSADGEQDEHAVDAEHQTSTSRNPHRVFQRVKTCQPWIGGLFIPGIMLAPSRITRSNFRVEAHHPYAKMPK